MKTVVTVTMNPAFDIATEVEELIPEQKLRCGSPREDPGGGGINVARALTQLGGRVKALYPAGGPTGRRIRELLEAQEVEQIPIPIEGTTRENILVQETQSGRNFRFVLPGPALSEREWQACLDKLAELEPKPDYLIASGSLPQGVPEDFYARLARVAKHDMHLIVDASGEPLRAAVEEGVWLMRCNHHEFAEMTGRSPETDGELKELTREIVERNGAEVVIVTLGDGGALLTSREGHERAYSPDVDVVSPRGAGDNFVAALVFRLAQEKSLKEALRYAVAGAAAALLRPGTGRLRPEKVEDLCRQVRLQGPNQ